MHRIAAGIVLYNPELIRLNENINSILTQVQKVILVDNGSKNIEEIEEIYSKNEKIIILKNKENLGIAKALNQIIKYSNINNFQWVLTLDQDSICPNDLILEYEKYIKFERVAIITPNIIDRNSNNINNFINEEYQFVEECITSACLTNVKICIEIGGFDERMFIDVVDFDYCVKVILNNYKILKVNTTTLLHEVGKLKEKNILGKEIHVYNHSVIRKYYYCRNMVYFCKKYKGMISTKKYYNKLIKRFIVVLLYEDKKMKKLGAMSCGVKDGIKMHVNN